MIDVLKILPWITKCYTIEISDFNLEVNPDNSITNTTPGTINTSTDITQSTKNLDAVENQQLKDTINKIFSNKLLAILAHRDAFLKKKAGLCHLLSWNQTQRNQPFLPLVVERNECGKQMLMQWWTSCETNGKRKSFAGGYTCYTSKQLRNASFAQYCWWPHILWDVLAKANECKAGSDIAKK